MPPELPTEPPAPPLATPVLPPSKPRRPPVPWWMWLVFTVGAPFLGGALGALIGLLAHTRAGFNEAMEAGAAWGTFSIPVLVVGLALSGRFFENTGSRIAGTLIFTFLVLGGLAAIVLAGFWSLLNANQPGR